MSENPTPPVEPISLAEFLESVPPAHAKSITTQISAYDLDPNSGEIRRVQFAIPQIQLHCPSDSCNGERFFRAAEDPIFLPLSGQYGQYEYLVFTCANCQKYTKVFALAIFVYLSKTKDDEQPFTAYCHKIGEYPPFGPPTPSRLISLMGPDRELFLKGRRAENQGLGIGAFVYYRRVVEDQKNRIIAEIIKVAEMISAPSATITALRNAQKEHQFSRAVETIKDAIPQRLLIAGQNPLTLLHSALSRGLHQQTDEKCLELASDIRVISCRTCRIAWPRPER
jgi:hypothetical protein